MESGTGFAVVFVFVFVFVFGPCWRTAGRAELNTNAKTNTTSVQVPYFLGG